MLGTYAATLIVLGSSMLAGQALLVACGQRRASPLAPAIGLGPVIAIAWGAIRLPGEASTALFAVLGLALVAGVYIATRVERGSTVAAEALPAALLALALASIPFVLEGRFGVLGTGFNVDMSQHLFAADWLASPSGLEPGLVEQGYPLGPHALAAAASELAGGNLVQGFDGLMVAIPVIAAVASLAVLDDLPPVRRAGAAALVALAYLVVSYYAQGQFKELLQALFVLAFALYLHKQSGRVLGFASAAAGAREGRARSLSAVPLAAIAVGSVYAYSAPGLVWLGGAAALWAVAELWRHRDQGVGELVRRAAAPAAIALAVLAVAVLPEIGRVAEFRSNATSVAGVEEGADRGGGGGGGGGGGARDGGGGGGGGHDNDLGNLFDDISPAEVFGIWPSGDFRVDPGGGGVPAAAFHLGVLLGVAAFLFALLRWVRRGETAVPAALVAAAAIYVAALAFSTPYANAKALMMVAAPVMLVAVREMAAPETLSLEARAPRTVALGALAAAFLVAAAGSTLLVLGKAPVGPTEYSRGLAEMRPLFEGRPTLVLAEPTALEEAHARDFLDWEARGGDPVCIEPTPAPGGVAPAGIEYVVTTHGQRERPYRGLSAVEIDGPYALWERRHGSGGSRPAPLPDGEPSECVFETVE